MDNYYGIKELYSVAIKATYNMSFAGRNYEEGETIFSFDKIQIAHLSEDKSSTSARGGYGNNPLISWDNTRDVQFYCSEGVLSKKSIGIISNSKIFVKNEELIEVPIINEEHEPENGVITLKYQPNGKGFIYDLATGEKLFSNLTEQTYTAAAPIIADYYYNYDKGATSIEIGNQAFPGYLHLEGKMRLKDDKDGHDKTAIVVIPRIKISSSLSMRLGRNAEPTVGNFSFIGYPVGERNSQKVCFIHILNDDIDSDF